MERPLPLIDDESGVTRTYQAHVRGYVNLPVSTGVR